MPHNVEASRLLTQQSAWMVDQGLHASRQSSIAKCFATDMAMQVATDAVQIFGGNGYMAEYQVEQLYRDARVMRIYAGTDGTVLFQVPLSSCTWLKPYASPGPKGLPGSNLLNVLAQMTPARTAWVMRKIFAPLSVQTPAARPYGVLFAFSTAIAWSYYGDRAVTFLWGVKYVRYYRMVYVFGFFAAAIIGADRRAPAAMAVAGGLCFGFVATLMKIVLDRSSSAVQHGGLIGPPVWRGHLRGRGGDSSEESRMWRCDRVESHMW